MGTGTEKIGEVEYEIRAKNDYENLCLTREERYRLGEAKRALYDAFEIHTAHPHRGEPPEPGSWGADPRPRRHWHNATLALVKVMIGVGYLSDSELAEREMVEAKVLYLYPPDPNKTYPDNGRFIGYVPWALEQLQTERLGKQGE
ncbi:hypothetical protein A2721_00255 [Candidatus Gottesmanbacteria bacterium RIFCSPHIGHO2_01_FULL_47_48]|uniref:Uncharacterized protein n=1 Tax=Candidatus Gottesmanbacteria bacterium RIFCSPHIGHO2_01_FULL_47_48 TaxID=1798381 RepID=A0A1F6A3J7_9BACT|nr:MAG: hypothetical protein A2721_00255 [Candidatus Gottesmanbacteria bacterium RIFCSPHIGHO2_01_FULL_47_48]